MPTLILYQRFDEDTQLMWDAGIKAGWMVVRGTPIPGSIPLDEQIAIYGGVMWGGRVAESLRKRLSWPKDDWLTNLPFEVTKRRVVQMSGKEVQDGEFPAFIKSLNWKSIASRTYQSKADLPPAFPVEEQFLVSEHLPFHTEFRAFMLDGKVATISPYADHGILDYQAPGLDEAKAFISHISPHLWQLPRAVCLDVGYTGKGWAVIEANPAWCSGVYGCATDKVLEVVAACVEPL